MKVPVSRQLGLIMVLLGGVSATGCLFQNPTPDQVMTHFAEAMSQLTSFHYSVNLTLSGRLDLNLVPDVSSATVNLAGDVVNKDANSPKFTLQAKLTGVAPAGNLAIAGELVNLDDYTYFRLTDLTVPTLLPVALGADSQWYKIHHVAPADPDEKKLGVTDTPPLTTEQIQSIRALLAQTPLMEVVEVMPDDTVNNQRSYHFKVALKTDAVQSLGDQLSKLLNLGQPIQNLDAIAHYQPEIWVNKRTFQLSQFKLNDIYLRNNVPVAFDLTLGLSRHNENFNITVPQATNEIDPAKLLQDKFGL